MVHLTRGALALVVLFAHPLSAAAQEPTGSETMQLAVDNRQADRLVEKAVALEADQASWEKAADMYEKSAKLRVHGDIRAYQAYQKAGNLLYFRGQPEAARRMFVRAAQRALESGHVYEAAQAYATSVELIADHGARPVDRRTAMQHREMVLRLSESPLLTEEQRRAVRNRVRA